MPSSIEGSQINLIQRMQVASVGVGEHDSLNELTICNQVESSEPAT